MGTGATPYFRLVLWPSRVGVPPSRGERTGRPGLGARGETSASWRRREEGAGTAGSGCGGGGKGRAIIGQGRERIQRGSKRRDCSAIPYEVRCLRDVRLVRMRPR